MTDNKALANLLFPDIKSTPEDFEKMYPCRQLAEGAMVTRFAPSPTGFVHFGGLFVSLIDQRLAHQSKGVYCLRIEDTDKKREVEGGVENIVKSLAGFDILSDEGVMGPDSEKGSYGPYKQSERAHIYHTFVKQLVEKGLAYPCFCTEEDLDRSRKEQEESKIRPGYYSRWAVHRDFTFEQIKTSLEEGKTFVVRLKSPGDPEKRIVLHDQIKGDIEMPENDQDVVILKSDGLPTYHFAHAVDDHFMRTTHVVRGDEWLSSAPLHLQLFEALGWEAPRYCHISPIMKQEGSSKRKLSKRKDPEATVTYYHEQGYPSVSVIEYLLNLTNSNFEDWRRENPTVPNNEFKIDFEKMSVSGSLFDIVKLTDISKDLVAMMTVDQVYELALKWAEEYDAELAGLMKENDQYARSIFKIERYGEKPRKDIAKWSDVRTHIEYFYDSLFNTEIAEKGYSLPENAAKENMIAILTGYKDNYNPADDKDGWLDRIRSFCEALGYSRDVKTFKKNPGVYKGHIGDVTQVIRAAMTNRKNTPDLYEIMQVMGTERVMTRLDKAAKSLAE